MGPIMSSYTLPGYSIRSHYVPILGSYAILTQNYLTSVMVYATMAAVSPITCLEVNMLKALLGLIIGLAIIGWLWSVAVWNYVIIPLQAVIGG